MADKGIKKVVVPKETLGSVGPDNNYLIRYRVVSEDKNRWSHWSPIYSILSNDVETSDGDINILGSTILVSWTDSSERTGYDIFVAFGDVADNKLVYHGTTTSKTYSFLSSGVLPVRVLVQAQSIQKTVNLNNLKIYDETKSAP